MTFPSVTIADWRAQVEKELAGVPFEKALVHTTAEGLAVQPLYTELPATPALPRPARAPFAVCMPYDGDDAGLAEDLAGGAESFWIRDGAGVGRLLGNAEARGKLLVIDVAGAPHQALEAILVEARRQGIAPGSLRFVLAGDAACAVRVARECPLAHGAMVSTLAWHLAGADAADELGAALSSGAALLEELLDAGLSPIAAMQQIAVQVAVGGNTFGELCKLRALRVCWGKLSAAVGAPEAPLALLHAAASLRTATVRDPWVNMLRGTTEAFAAILGGADLVTPIAYDAALGPASALGRRVARNTALVLREESQVGRVVDPAGGSYFLEALTDVLAREAWKRFRAIEADGGIAALVADGRWQARLDVAWRKRREAVAKRKEPIVGVTEFVNLDEQKLPRTDEAPPGHRDAEEIEALRDRTDELVAAGTLPSVALVTLGPPAEHRARLGYASAFFAVGGLRARATQAMSEPSTIACLCGSDERYGAEAAPTARALKAAGVTRVLLAGRPGALEPSLREAGVDGFIFVGCDVAATLREILGARS